MAEKPKTTVTLDGAVVEFRGVAFAYRPDRGLEIKLVLSDGRLVYDDGSRVVVRVEYLGAPEAAAV